MSCTLRYEKSRYAAPSAVVFLYETGRWSDNNVSNASYLGKGREGRKKNKEDFSYQTEGIRGVRVRGGKTTTYEEKEKSGNRGGLNTVFHT